MKLFDWRWLAVCGLGLGFRAGAETVWSGRFDDAANWPEAKSYHDSVKFDFGAAVDGKPSALRVTGIAKRGAKDPDTAWRVRTKRLPLAGRAGATYRFTVSFRSEKVHRFTQAGDGYATAIYWYDAAGAELVHHGIMKGLRRGGFLPWKLVGKVPENAAAFEVQIGLDDPDLDEGETLCLADASLELVAEEPCGAFGPDVDPPRVTRTSPSPTTDAATPVVLRMTDETEVDWKTLKIVLDGADATARFVRRGNELTLTPSVPWSEGHHLVRVELGDVLGNAASYRKVFFIGRPPKPEVSVTLREDGVTLVGGKPFFPIGIYSVRKCPFNRWNLEDAMAELKTCGFNACHTYNDPGNPEFWQAAEKSGLLLWVNASGGGFSSAFTETTRHSDRVLAWYIGDDTATHVKPEELRDRDEGLKASDPNRVTVQADYVESYRATDRYERFADATDVLLAEMYPVHGDASDTNCVAEVIRDMLRIRSDNLRRGGKRTHAVWPIIQNFVGWHLWKRYPTADQVRAMTFATLVYGAKGMTWYTYAPNADGTPEKPRFEGGITGNAAAWNCATNLSAQLSALAPVLVERGDTRRAAKILSGPEKDGYGNPSVAYLVKRHAGETYVLAVNSSSLPVRAELAVDSAAAAEALWENRKVGFGNGRLAEDFPPYGVHVYRIL